MDSIIEDVRVRKILDSRGNPTVEVDIITWNGFGRAAAPSGASTGSREVKSFPEGGVDKVIGEVEDVISSELIGMDAEYLSDIDLVLKEIDGTDNMSAIGGNTSVAVSMAAAKAAAASYNLPLYKFLGGNMKNELPYPLGNMMNGGAHAGVNAPDIQEFLVVPVGAKSIEQAVFGNVAIHKKLKELIAKKDSAFTGGKGDEGGWIPNVTNDTALEIQAQACEEVSNELGFEIRPSLDFASSEFWDADKGKYVYEQDGIERDTGEQVEYVKDIINTYGMFYVEDPFDENDFDGFSQLTSEVGDKCLICGDDLFVTNKEYLAKGIAQNAANAIIIKPNQIGSLTETYATVKLAKENNVVPVVSHRSGETTDETIAHLAVAWGAPIIKTGAVSGERIAKLNELIRIEEELSDPKMASFN
ncbi:MULTISPECIES: phosphopyruvate hydratase [Methanobrevibacter]|uniref:phosphopyruvate hydratase n=1 Tax=Methanobrevibacter TaxID=2172 RepID=UPI0003348502|nr:MULTISPECIES: phosphopyruvate hydratase [Methanobrevibacter]AGN17117.1 phosphopyruvate hydratase Eno [Methanobrevibacter sp. AbM4]MCI6774487.1 phosphopyruvate hydratase [Methanobrevibacter boviskoreani]MCI6929677.1 phosphopyruvate hydratase [Methanobrevibacter boviskoreani]MDY5614004.1 phosphopyruvate hydratase [Methanobrevibacter boviskoreani]